MTAPTRNVLRESIAAHLTVSRGFVRRAAMMAFALPALVLLASMVLSAVLVARGGDASAPLVLVALVVLLAVLVAPAPLAVYYVNVMRIRGLERELDRTPGLIQRCEPWAYGGGGLFGNLFLGSAYGESSPVLVTTVVQETYVLRLSAQLADELCSRFPGR